MAQLDIETALDWRGRTVVDRDGDKIGKFDEVYLDESDNPAWAAVTTGLFGMRQTFVPLSEAEPDGDVLRVPFDQATVKDAPNVDPDAQLTPEEEDTLYRHYGLGGGEGRAAADDTAGAGEGGAVARRDDEQVVSRGSDAGAGEGAAATERSEGVAEGDGDGDGEREGEPTRRSEVVADDREDAGGETADGEGAEMIRSEEEVEVGTRRRVTGKARLRKYVVTEHVKKVVPVQREEVRVEYEPADGEGGSDAPGGPAPGPAGGGAESGAGDAPAGGERPAAGTA